MEVEKFKIFYMMWAGASPRRYNRHGDPGLIVGGQKSTNVGMNNSIVNRVSQLAPPQTDKQWCAITAQGKQGPSVRVHNIFKQCQDLRVPPL